MRIDLHTHSDQSDGTEAPEQVIATARAAGLDVVALTDHDSTRGWEPARQAAERLGVGFLPGVEISCKRDGQSIHLLGYLMDPADQGLATEWERVRESRLTRMDRMVEKMAAGGIPISIEQVRAQVQPGATLGRPHLADALIAAGVIPDRATAFQHWLHDDGPYYVGHYALDPVRAVELVGAAGGVSVLAHPFTSSRGRGLDPAVVHELVAAGLDGLEVNHRDHDGPARELARSIVAEHDLIATGSSDYHGDGKPNRLGENVTAPEQLERIVAVGTGTAYLPPR